MSDNENETEDFGASVPQSPNPVTTDIDYLSNDIHEEVECMLAGDNEDIIELISTDPKYYLGIIENYKQMRDGKEIYLPDLFNILVSKNETSMHIKFKMSDNSQWHEVGYNGGEFSEEEVYKCFTEKVNHVIKNPPMSRRAFLEDTMAATVDRPPPMINQGNQNKLSKIDRFLGRTDHAYDATCTITPKNNPPLEPSPSEPKIKSVTIPSNKPNLVQQVVETSSNLSDRLNKLKQDCPESLIDDYCKLSQILSSGSPFVNGLLSLTNDVGRAKASIIYQFLMDVPVEKRK
jgi:hypothetical protein